MVKKKNERKENKREVNMALIATQVDLKGIDTSNAP